MKIIAIWGLVAIGSSVAAGILAGLKNRDYSFWMAWCFFLPPLLLVLLLMPQHKGPRRRQPTADEIDRIESAERP